MIERPHDPDPDVEFDGYCARSCAAYKYLVEHDTRAAELAADPDVTLRPAKPDGFAESHYWLVNSAGEILELNLGAYDKPFRYPYRDGTGASVLRDRRDPTRPARKDTANHRRRAGLARRARPPSMR